MTPLYRITKSNLKQKQQQGYGSRGISTTSINPNPQLKKYYFWIYHYNMPYSSAQEVLFKDEHKLSLKKSIDLMNHLKKNDIPFAYANRAHYRLGNKVFDYKKLKEKYPDIEFAVVYSEDKDEVCKELNGHK